MNLRFRRFCITAAILVPLCMATAAPVKVDPKNATVPPAEEINPTALNLAARAAIARGIEFFHEKARQDEERWIFPPVRTKQVVGHKTITLNWRKVPAPTYEYEWYEVYERVQGRDSQSAKTLRKVRRHRIKGIKDPEGSFKLVRDDDGDITLTHNIPVYGEGGPDYWPTAYLGHNALILFAMREAGVPANDETLLRIAENLENFMNWYGLPDMTWDLAWITSAFSRMPGKIYETRCNETADKILDGQILDGGARGMWGPVCINTDLLATYVLPGLSDEVELAAGSGRLHGTETGVLCHSSPSLSHCWRK